MSDEEQGLASRMLRAGSDWPATPYRKFNADMYEHVVGRAKLLGESCTKTKESLIAKILNKV